MTNKERYIEWVGQQEYIPIYMMPWWMDAVCAGKMWDVLLAEDENGRILGAMPYLLRKRAQFRYIIMPQQTQIGGLWVTAEVTADKWKTAEVCRQIKEQLDGMHLAYYYQQYLPGSLCVDAMRGLGFKTQERVTYRVDDLSDIEALVSSFSKNKRRQLQKAQGLHVERGMNPEEVFCIGGAMIYRLFLPYCDTALITRIDHIYDADAFLPDLDNDSAWEKVRESEEQVFFDLTYRFCTYKRKGIT